MVQSQHDRRRCRRPLSGAPLTIGSCLAPTARSGLAATVRRVKSATAPPDFLAATCRLKRCRLGPLNPHSKVLEVSNQLGHFIIALKQSLSTMKTTHIRNSHPNRRSSAHCDTCTTRQDFPTPEEYCSTKGECSKPMRERPQRLRPTGLNGTRARSDGPCNTVQNRKKLPIAQKRTKAPRCKLKRCARGCEPATRTPHPSSHGTELSLAWPCPVGAAGCTHKSW